MRGAFTREESWPADLSQLKQSRLGLVSQAIFMLIIVLFIFSEVLGSFWKDRLVMLVSIGKTTHCYFELTLITLHNNDYYLGSLF